MKNLLLLASFMALLLINCSLGMALATFQEKGPPGIHLSIDEVIIAGIDHPQNEMIPLSFARLQEGSEISPGDLLIFNSEKLAYLVNQKRMRLEAVYNLNNHICFKIPPNDIDLTGLSIKKLSSTYTSKIWLTEHG